MKQVQLFIGRLALVFGWPVLWVYFKTQPARTRVVVVCNGQVLLVRSWVGSGKFGLPGGGLYRNERAVDGAIRELHEETGIVVRPDELTHLTDIARGDHGFTYTQHCYYVVLQRQPVIRLQKYEIVDAVWLGLKEAKALTRHSTTGDILQEFSRAVDFDTL